MAPKRPLEAEAAGAAGPATKKHRKGFRVGPANLPDGPWKRKVDKIKKELIHKAKVKKAYKKIKAREEAASKSNAKSEPEEPAEAASKDKIAEDDGKADDHEKNDEDAEQPPSPQIHPERQAMLVEDEEDEAAPTKAASDDQDRPPRRRKPNKQRKPGYFDRALEEGGQKKAEAEARAQEFERRKAERERKLAERQRFNRALAKARKPGRDGNRKLGRESGLMLEKVKRLVGDGK